MLVDLSIWRGRGNTELLVPSDHSHPIFYATPLQLLTTGKGSAFLHVWWHWTMHHEWCAQTWNSTHIWICFWISICQTQIYVSMDCTPCKELSLRPTLRTGGSQKLNWSEPMFALEDRTPKYIWYMLPGCLYLLDSRNFTYLQNLYRTQVYLESNLN